MVKYMLTTVDNPYNPVNNFNQWLLYDSLKGYNSCQYLERIVSPLLKDSMSEEEQAEVINNSIEEIIDKDFMNVYTKVPFEEDITMFMKKYISNEDLNEVV